jgi:hypothetical protein
MTLTDHERLPYERSPADALEAFRQGQGWEAPLGGYFEELAEGLTMLAELFNGGTATIKKPIRQCQTNLPRIGKETLNSLGLRSSQEARN